MRKTIITLAFALLLLPCQAVMAKSYKISVNQFVEHPALDAVLKGFQDYLTSQGIDAQYKVHIAQANPATANQIAQQIAGENADLVLAIATPSAQACAQAIKKSPELQKTPLLFSAITDPVGAGLVKDMNKPGGNITGVSDLIPVDQHMAMLKEFLPNMKKLGFLYNAGETNSKTILAMVKEQGKAMGFEVVEATAAKSSDVYQATKSLVGRCDAVFIPTDNTVITGLEAAVKVCAQNNLPLFAADVDSVPRGALAAMGFDYYKHGRQTGAMALKILKGKNPGTMPVETQEAMSLHVNLDSAKSMNISVPESILKKAEKVLP